MNTTLVPGLQYIVYIYVGGIWKPYGCARSGNISVNTSMIETTGPGNGNWKTNLPTVHDFTAQLDGVVSINNNAQVTLADLQALQFAKTSLLMRFTQTSVAGDIYTKQAYFFITNSTDTGSFDGVATFSISLVGSGPITQVFTPPTPNTGEVFRYPQMGSTAPATPGASTVTIAGLGNMNILAVHKDGIGNNDIILTGTPVNKEVLYETVGADGVFTWAIPFDDGENYYILYQTI